MEGTVIEWNHSYGFIEWYQPTGAGTKRRRTFVHQSNLLMAGFRHLSVGDVVEFEIGTDDTGRQGAMRVKVIQPAETES